VEGLTLGPGLVLPVEAVTETFAILAKRGAGKTYTAAVLVEEMMSAGLPVVIIDPVGVWWGLRSSADGTAEGLPVVIFGGDHADLPLAETTGELLADLVVDEPVPAVLDLSTLSKSAARRFMTDLPNVSTTGTGTPGTTTSSGEPTTDSPPGPARARNVATHLAVSCRNSASSRCLTTA